MATPIANIPIGTGSVGTPGRVTTVARVAQAGDEVVPRETASQVRMGQTLCVHVVFVVVRCVL